MTDQPTPLTDEELQALVMSADAHEPPPDVRGQSGWMTIFTATVRRLVAEVRTWRAAKGAADAVERYGTKPAEQPDPPSPEEIDAWEADLDSGRGYYLQDSIEEPDVRRLFAEVRRLRAELATRPRWTVSPDGVEPDRVIPPKEEP